MEQSRAQAPAIAASESLLLLRYADKLGQAIEPLLAEFGLTRGQLEDPDGWIPLAKYLALRERAAEEWRDPFLGLHMAERARVVDHGALGFVIQHAPTVRQALADLVRYIHVVKEGVECGFRETVAGCFLSYRLLGSEIRDRRQDSESVLTLGVAMLRELAGDSWSLLEVQFEHSRPAGVSELERFFQAPLTFGRPINVLIFPCEILEQRLPQANPALYQVVRRHAESVLEARAEAESLADEVERIVTASLTHGEPRIADVAQSLALSGRTLQRRLSELGTTFAEIVEDTRRSHSTRYLCDPGLRLTEIAFLLGYSELSAFHRAFRRWNGMTPQEYRRLVT